MQQTAVPFTADRIPPLAEAGGKAKSLMETVRAGFPVPDGFVLCASFFAPWMEQLRTLPAWNGLLHKAAKDTCDSLKAAAEGFSFTDTQREAFDTRLAALGGSVFAVRSSSPEEDMARASFAGMYETQLGVRKSALETVVAQVFASMLDYRVMEYKQTRGLSVEQSKIAVIVQKQLASDVSGIGFSVNPHNNSYDEVVLNAAFGLGEAIVSGIVTPDEYTADTVSHTILQKRTGEKAFGLFLTHDGVPIRRINANAYAQALTDEQIFDVASLVKRCEKHYGFPVDTEWAYENGRLYLLQARPITTYFPLYPALMTEPGETKNLYLDLVLLTQGFDRPLSELGCELFEKLVKKAIFAFIPADKDMLIRCVHGKIYLHVNLIARLIGKPLLMRTVGRYDAPNHAVLEAFDFTGYLPRKRPKSSKGTVKSALRVIRVIAKRAFAARRDFPAALAAYQKNAADALAVFDRLRGSTLPFAEQTQRSMEAFRAHALYFFPLALSLFANGAMKKLFAGRNLDADIAALNTDLQGNPTAEMGYLQMRLAAFPELQAVSNEEEFAHRLGSGGFSSAFMEAYEAYMHKFGCRCMGEIDIASPRAYEDTDTFYQTLYQQRNTDDAALHAVKQKKQQAYDHLLQTAKEMGKEKQFLLLYGRMNWAGIREYPKYVYVSAAAVLRENALRIADSLVLEKRLMHRNDIFLCDIASVTRAQADASFSLIPVAEQNRRARSMTEHVRDWPRFVDSRGKIFTACLGGQNGDFIGDPVSHGVAQGTAKVLHAPFEKPVEKGDVLVIKAAEPSWTPMFLNAAAVVMEVGGALQHGAIIAREYGIPCVTGVDGCTRLIADNDVIEVDGTSGVVRFIKKAPQDADPAQ